MNPSNAYQAEANRSSLPIKFQENDSLTSYQEPASSLFNPQNKNSTNLPENYQSFRRPQIGNQLFVVADQVSRKRYRKVTPRTSSISKIQKQISMNLPVSSQSIQRLNRKQIVLCCHGAIPPPHAQRIRRCQPKRNLPITECQEPRDAGQVAGKFTARAILEKRAVECVCWRGTTRVKGAVRSVAPWQLRYSSSAIAAM